MYYRPNIFFCFIFQKKKELTDKNIYYCGQKVEETDTVHMVSNQLKISNKYHIPLMYRIRIECISRNFFRKFHKLNENCC